METSNRDQKKEARRLEIVKAAAIIYSDKGIDSTTIQEVADIAQLGVASVYRYFPGKIDLAVETALFNWKKAINPIMNNMALEENAWDSLNIYMNGFLFLFRNNPDFFRFIEFFDNYISRQKKKPDSFREYEQLLQDQDNDIIEILLKGQKKLSIRSDIDIIHQYSVSTKAIMAFAQKLLLRGNIIQADNTDHYNDLKTLITILLDNIKRH